MTPVLEQLLPLEIHAFVSQGFILTTDNNYLAESTQGSPEFTEIGINFGKNVTDDLRFGVQLFARDLGPIGNFTARFDWAFLDYRWSDWLGVRIGRIKLPFGLYNETSDTDAARVPVLLPQSLYPIQNRDFLLAQAGGELYGFLQLGGAGALSYNVYGGTISIGASQLISESLEVHVSTIGTPYLFGGRLFWETPLESLRAGGSVQALRVDADVEVGGATLEMLRATSGTPDLGPDFQLQIPAILWVASAEYAGESLTLAAEYSRWHTRSRLTPAIGPETKTTSERFYGLAAYQLSESLQASAYYSVLFPDVSDRETRARSQQDWALTLRWDVNSFWLFKLEAHYLRGTAALSPALNGGRSPLELERDWGLFLAKTTLYF